MKAAVYYEPGDASVFRYQDVPDPECRPGGIVFAVEAVSIEGGDVLHRAGGELATQPHIVGYQAAGTVREVGERVTAFAAGDKVVATMPFGSHAELISVPARAAFAIPVGGGFLEAACAPITFGTADDCLFEFGHLVEGETVLVQAGASGVGLAAIQLAKRAGATVIATASNDGKLARLTGEFGLDQGINYVERDFVEAARELTEGRGPDLVVDAIGGKTLQGSLECVAYRGRVITVGGAGRDDTPLDRGPILQKNASLIGVFLGGEMAADHARTHTMMQRHVDDVAAGNLRMPVDRTFPLADAAAAHAYIESRQAFGRVVLSP